MCLEAHKDQVPFAFSLLVHGVSLKSYIGVQKSFHATRRELQEGHSDIHPYIILVPFSPFQIQKQ